jgi:signal transduction histidine kinase
MAISASLEGLRLAEADRLSRTALHSLDTADAGARIALEMVRSLLDIHRLENGVMPMADERCDIAAIVGEAVDMVRGLRGRRSIQVEVVPGLEWSADPVLLRRVVGNLLSNACHATREEGRIEVRAREEGGAFHLEVVDDGRGVPPELHDRVFEKFAQVHSQKTGSGLGLVFCRLAVEAQGGSIGVASDGRRGARFWLTLPGDAVVAGSPSEEVNCCV